MTPHDVLDRAGLTGHRVGLRPAGAGRRNHVWFVEVDGSPLVVRTLAAGGRAEMEVAVLHRCRRAGIPVPEVLWWSDDSEAPAMVQSALAGTRLAEIDPAAIPPALPDHLAEIARTIHSVPVEGGFGNLGSSLAGTWESLADWFVSPPRAEVATTALGAADHELATAGLALLEDAAPLLDAQPSSLVHGDLQPENVLVDGDRVTGVIDWEAAKAGPAALDLGWWDWWSEAFGVPWGTDRFVVAGRPEPGPEPVRVRELVVVRVWVRELVAAVRCGDALRAEAARRGLRRHGAR